MHRHGRLMFLRIAVVSAIVIIALGFVVWKAMVAGIHTAPMAEIQAVLPKELLVETPSNASAQDRYTKLVKLLKTLDEPVFRKIVDTERVKGDHWRAATAFWQSNPNLCRQINAIVDSGPLELGSTGPYAVDSLPTSLYIIGFYREAAMGAKLYADHGDFDFCTDLLLTCCRLNSRILAGKLNIIAYLYYVLLEGITDGCLQDSISVAGFPKNDCKRLLDKLTAAPNPDEFLAGAFRTEFQQHALPTLADIRKEP